MASLAIYFGWLGALMLGTLRWPAVAVGGMLCANGLYQWGQASVPMIAARPMVSNYAVGAALLLGLVVMFFQQKPLLRRYPAAGWLAIILWLYCLMTILWSINPDLTIKHLSGRWMYLMVTVVLTPLLIVDSRDLLHTVISLIVLGSVIVIMLLLTSNFATRTLQTVEYGTAAMLNPLGLATMGGYVAVAATLMNFRGIGRLLQVGRWVLVALAMMLVIVTQSRGQFIAMFIVTILFLPMSRRMRNWWGFFGSSFGVGLVIVLSMWLISTYGWSGRWAIDEMSLNFYETRIEPAVILLSEWLGSNPLYWLLGLGSSASFDPTILGHYPHFVTAEVLGELGLIGFGIFVSILVLTARSTLRLSRMFPDNPVHRGVVAAVSALFWMNFILSFKQGSLLQSLDLMLFAIILGRYEMAVADEYAAHQADQPPEPTLTRAVYAMPIHSHH